MPITTRYQLRSKTRAGQQDATAARNPASADEPIRMPGELQPPSVEADDSGDRSEETVSSMLTDLSGETAPKSPKLVQRGVSYRRIAADGPVEAASSIQ